MKKLGTLLILCFVCSMVPAKAQTFKFGHINLQETVYLMSEMDSAIVTLEKYSKDLQETFVSMQNEFQSKYNTYQQMSANWTPVVLQAKEKELQEMQQRLQQFEQSAQTELQQKQQEILAPIYKKANEALTKVGKANGFTYVFDISTATIPYVNDAVSINVSDMVKKELNIPLDKKLPKNTQIAK